LRRWQGWSSEATQAERLCCLDYRP
jgi:hypothetical protein